MYQRKITKDVFYMLLVRVEVEDKAFLDGI